MFYEICEGKLTITNIGQASLDINVICDEETDTPEPGWLNVIPRRKNVLPGKNLILLVRYYPGLSGYFSRKFNIEVRSVVPSWKILRYYLPFRSTIWNQ